MPPVTVTISLGPRPFRPLPLCDGPHCPWLCLHPSPAAACCQATASCPSPFSILLQGLCSPVLWLTTGGLGLGLQQTEHFLLPMPLHLSPRMPAAPQSLWCSPLRKGAHAWGGEPQDAKAISRKMSWQPVLLPRTNMPGLCRFCGTEGPSATSPGTVVEVLSLVSYFPALTSFCGPCVSTST